MALSDSSSPIAQRCHSHTFVSQEAMDPGRLGGINDLESTWHTMSGSVAPTSISSCPLVSKTGKYCIGDPMFLAD